MRRRTSPVQQWVDSLPSPAKSTTSIGSIVRQQSISVDSKSTSIPDCTVETTYSEKNYIRHSNMTVSTPISVPDSPAMMRPCVSKLARDPSFQSDSSHCSSVESLLELRRADPEAVLLNLGFGGNPNSPQDAGPLSRIPKRFLQPSRLKGIAVEDFVKHQQEASESLDSTSLGYRGLTGSPYVAPSEIVQKIMQRLREHESHESHETQEAFNAIYGVECNNLPQQQEGRLSVLSPDNRMFLERPRSKSPDMRNKRMIIGQRSFAFGRDGDLIEIKSRSTQSLSQESDDGFEYSDETKETTNQTTTITTNTTGPTIHVKHESTQSASSSSGSGFNTPKVFHRSCPHFNKDSMETVISVRSTNVSSSNSSNSSSSSSSSSSSNKNNKSSNNNNNKEEGVEENIEDKSHSHQNPNTESILSTSPRRASEKSHEYLKYEEEQRRFSDSIVDSMKKSESNPRKKIIIKRQSRMSDSDAEETICIHCGKPQKDYGEEDVTISCCYKRNKKLVDVVNKSRREMAEIKDMLSSVLSVRMEPGF